MAPRRALTLSRSPPLTARVERAVALALAGCAVLLSVIWQLAYLRGGPRIVDAATYFHEASLLARGELSVPVGEVPAAVLGRFLVPHEEGGALFATPIFPPGWPAALAVGFWVGAPFAVSPVVAALLVLVTWQLGRELGRDLGLGADVRTGLGLAAAIASTLCAALRYHTADTMSHGWAALLGATALVATARGKRSAVPARWALLVGLSLGWVAATRPVSALPVGAAVLALAWGSNGMRPAPLLALALGAAPPLALFAAHAHAATGSLVGSSQRLYYALADGPTGCFRLGFGEGIGCLGEHGDFVRARLPHGYGALEAAGTTARRLAQHLLDVLNAEPSFLLVALGVPRARTARLGAALTLAVVLQPLVYAPFYFDGNYPGGGGRMLADVLPLEHALLALGALTIVSRAGCTLGKRRATAGPAALVATLAILGFGLRAREKHEALRDRDGGLPEVSLSALSGVPAGAVIFVEGDAGFSVASALAGGRREVRRRRGGDLDLLAWQALGSPPSFELVVGQGATPWAPPARLATASALVLEAEDLWPARSQDGGYALPEWDQPACDATELGGGRQARGLVVRATSTAPARLSWWLPSESRLSEALGSPCLELRVHGRWPSGARASVSGPMGAVPLEPPLGSRCGRASLGAPGQLRGGGGLVVLSLEVPPDTAASVDAVSVHACAERP